MFKKRKAPDPSARKVEQEPQEDPNEQDEKTEVIGAAKRARIGRGELINENSSNAVKANVVSSSGGNKFPGSTAGGPSTAGQAQVSSTTAPGSISELREGEIYAVTADFDGGVTTMTGKDAATRTFNVDADHSQDQRAINERNAALRKQIAAGEIDANVYRGQNARKAYIEKAEGAISKSKITGTMGPVRGNQFIKSSARFDFWGTSGDGGVCKEYQQTGFCGYGDSCIYMHDRTLYKAGWQQERDWEEQQKKKAEKLRKRMERCRRADGEDEDFSSDESSSSEDAADPNKINGRGKNAGKMPKTCAQCKQEWHNLKSPPIITSCDHYFCESCAMANWKKSKKCAVCQAIMNGIFNNVEDVWEKQLKAQADAKIARKKVAEEKKMSGKSGVISNIPYQINTDKGKD